MALLAPDVTAWTDGGGRIRAALRPLHGADMVARWILGILQTPLPDLGIHPVLVNGEPGLLVTSAGVAGNGVAVDLSADGRRDAIRLIRNPDKPHQGTKRLYRPCVRTFGFAPLSMPRIDNMSKQ